MADMADMTIGPFGPNKKLMANAEVPGEKPAQTSQDIPASSFDNQEDAWLTKGLEKAISTKLSQMLSRNKDDTFTQGNKFKVVLSAYELSNPALEAAGIKPKPPKIDFTAVLSVQKKGDDFVYNATIKDNQGNIIKYNNEPIILKVKGKADDVFKAQAELGERISRSLVNYVVENATELGKTQFNVTTATK